MNPHPLAPTARPAEERSVWREFSARVEAEPGLLAKLFAAAPETAAFAAHAVGLASEIGLVLTADDVQTAVSVARRARLQRHVPPNDHDDVSCWDGLPSPDWLPIHVHMPGTSAASLVWAQFGNHRLTDPFFEQSTSAALRHPARLLFCRRTPLDRLDTFAESAGARTRELPPAGFVFHWSRCGSTLLAQLLATSLRHRVLSEAAPIDELLAHDAAAGLPHKRRVARLRALIALYSRKHFAEEERLFIKWDAWHTLHLPVIRDAFPDTPWVCLYRDPVEILVSQRRQRGFQFIPGMMAPELFGMTRAEVTAGMDFDTYAARVIGASAAAAVRALSEPGNLGQALDYGTLRETWPRVFTDHFKLSLSDEEWRRMHEAAARSAKNPSLPHTDDREGKHRDADSALRDLAERWIGESWRALREAGERV